MKNYTRPKLRPKALTASKIIQKIKKSPQKSPQILKGNSRAPLNPTAMLFRILEALLALQRGSKLKNCVKRTWLFISLPFIIVLSAYFTPFRDRVSFQDFITGFDFRQVDTDIFHSIRVFDHVVHTSLACPGCFVFG